MIRFTITALAVAAGLAAFASPGLAATDDAVPQGSLHTMPTDFTSTRSVDHLKSRLRRKALEICAPGSDQRVFLAPDERKCYETALQGGLAAIESRRLQALRRTSTAVAAAQPDDRPAH